MSLDPKSSSGDLEKVSAWSPGRPDASKTIVMLLTKLDFSCFGAYHTACYSVNQSMSVALTRKQIGKEKVRSLYEELKGYLSQILSTLD